MTELLFQLIRWLLAKWTSECPSLGVRWLIQMSSEIQWRKERTVGVCSLCHTFQHGIEKYLPPGDHHITKTVSSKFTCASKREILV